MTIGETIKIASANAVAATGTAVTFSGLEAGLKVSVILLNIFVAIGTIIWLRKKIKIADLELQIDRIELDKVDESSVSDTCDETKKTKGTV